MTIHTRFLHKAGVATLFVLISFTHGFAQQRDNSIQSIQRNKADNMPGSIIFAPSAHLKMDDAQDIFSKYLGITGADNQMVRAYHTITKQGVTTDRYYQYYKGIKVEYGSCALAGKEGKVALLTANCYNTAAGLSPAPAITADAAFAYAVNYVGATKYKWQNANEERHIKSVYHNPDTSYLPHGILVWIEDYRGNKDDRILHLAWSFDIYAEQPLSRQKVFIDAVTGKVLYANSLIKNTAATGHTIYSGVVPFQTSRVPGPTYELFDSTRGSGVHTMNMNNGTSYGLATEYTSPANSWPLAAADTVALDAHWGAEIVYDYWRTVQGRHSWDDLDGILDQYVHYDVAFDNAFWNGTEMTYGDGAGCGAGFTALVSLDVTAHEIGHAVCQATCNLIYQKEPGGIDEGLSDCWGATIENWGNPHEVDAMPKATWEMGEEIGCGTPLRHIDFPQLAHLPDTYLGTYWYDVTSCTPDGTNDQCGVHTNMGVISKWYYLITVGGSGTNDLGNAYAVTGLTFTKSQNILYQTELVLANNADYPALRTTSIATTATLYGNCSPEVIAVTNAWYAVGVGAAYVPVPAAIAGAVNICSGAAHLLTDATAGGTWSSSSATIASVDAGGLVTGLSAGTATITYSLGGSCIATSLATVNAVPTAAITPAGAAVLCAGSATTLAATTGAGYAYQWVLGVSDIPGATNSNYSATAGGNYSLVVTAAGGCSATSAVTIVSSVVSPAATISAGASATFCAGGSVTLTATAGAGYTYQWQLAGTPLPGITGGSYTTGTGGNYSVVVTNPAGCSATSAPFAVTVLPLPAATVTAAGPVVFCAPGSVVLNANTGAGLSYQWQNGGISIPGATAAAYTAAASGNYEVVVTQAGCSATSAPLAATAQVLAVAPVTGLVNLCVSATTPLADATTGGIWSSGSPANATVTAAGVVTGLAAGTASISYSFTNTCGTIVATNVMAIHAPAVVAGISGTFTVCTGGTTALADATPSGAWSSATPAIASVSAAGLVSGIATGTALISYTVTNAFGCASAATASVAVAALPALAISPAGPVAICPGGSIVLTAPSGAGYTYQWQSGGINISGATAATVSATATGSYRAVIANALGCSVTTSPVLVSVNTGLLVSPSVSIAAAPGNILCVVPSPVTFTATPVNGGAAPLFQWYVNGVSAGSGAAFGYTPANGDIVKCRLTSNNVCAAPDTASAHTSILITPLQTPSVSISMVSPVVCSGSTAMLTAAPVFGGSHPSYRWSRNDTVVATGASYAYVPHSGDVIRVSLFSNYPCLITDSAVSTAFPVSTTAPVFNTVAISVTQSGIVAGSIDTFIAIAPHGGSAPAYQWLLNGAAISGATAAIYTTGTLAQGDVITCEETSSAPCATPAIAFSTGISVRVIPAGVQQLSSGGTDFTLVPNPNNGSFAISGTLKNSATGKVSIMITDVLGQVVFDQLADALNGNINQHITLGKDVANGIYLVGITSGEAHMVYHMVISK